MNTTVLAQPHITPADTAPPSLPFIKEISIGTGRLIVFGFALFGVLLSVLLLMQQSLRLDEAQSLWQSSHTLSGILYIVAGDVHVPLYHFLLHFWQLFLGNSVETARAFSLIFFILSIPSIYALGSLAFSRKVGLFAALLVTISPFLNWYGSEIRMYSLLTFLSILNQYFFLRTYKRPGIGAWWGYGITAVLGMLTHYFFGMILLTQGIYFLLYRNLFPKKTFWSLVSVAGAVAVALAPWLWYVSSLGFASTTKPHLDPPSIINLFNTFAQFLFGFQDDHLNTLLISLWPISVLLAFLSIRKNTKVLPESTFFLLITIIPVTAAFIISMLWRPLFLSRYLILAVPSLYLFLGWVLSTYPKRIARVLQAGLVLAMLITSVTETTRATTPVKENYREVANYLRTQATAREVIIMSAPFTIYPVEYYYRGQAQITTLPIWHRYEAESLPAFSPDTLPLELEEVRSDRERMFIVFSYDQGYEQDIKLYLDTHLERPEVKQFSPGLTLHVYKLKY